MIHLAYTQLIFLSDDKGAFTSRDQGLQMHDIFSFPVAINCTFSFQGYDKSAELQLPRETFFLTPFLAQPILRKATQCMLGKK